MRRWDHNLVTVKDGAELLAHTENAGEDPLMVTWSLGGGCRVFSLTGDSDSLGLPGFIPEWDYARDFVSNIDTNPSNIEPQKLTLDSRFRFRCHPGVSCFTACCGNINIILTPYDILRIRRFLEISAERFTVAEKINHVLETLGASGGTATFEALFDRGAPRPEIIVTFLAVLELVKLLLIKIHQTEDGIIRVYSASPAEEEAPRSEKNGAAGLGVNGTEEMEDGPEAEADEAEKED